MKWFIASDIHGSAYYTNQMLIAFENENADKMLLLGDILYHGPRNDLPRDYSPKDVIAMLTPYANKILCVRGNCDTEVDQMVLPFPILADYAIICPSDRTVYATHGHTYNPDNLPPLAEGDILLFGHTHIPVLGEKNGYTYVNPGSVSIPKEGSECGYIVIENGKLTRKDFSGKELFTLVL
ncbi:MAG: phosphodiesterase [Clostridia bacterium]|nr:phosphodiesterase [Clostridia bacterium]